MNNYEATSREKPVFRNHHPFGGDADSEIDEVDELGQNGWFFYNNTGVGRGTIETAVNTALPTGLKAHPSIDSETLKITNAQAEKWQRNTKTRFDMWAKSKNADYYRMSDFAQLQQQALTTMLAGGDVLSLFARVVRPDTPYTLSLKLIEGAQLRNTDNALDSERLAGGVEIGPNGVEAYHFLKQHPKGIGFPQNEWVRVKAYSGIRQNVAHLMDKKRAGQRRGVSILAPIIESILQLKRMTSAELSSVITTSMLVAFIKSKDTDDEDKYPLGGDLSGEEPRFDKKKREYRLGNGTVVELEPGEEMEMFDPKKKNETFVPFMNAVISEICSATGIPPEVLQKKFDSSYSASRGALLEMWKFMKRLRHTIVSDLCQPVYNTWLLEEVVSGRIKAPGFLENSFARAAWSGATWIGDPQGLLNPNNEVQAAISAMDNFLSTGEQETFKLNGGDFDKNVERRKSELAVTRPLSQDNKVNA